MKSDEEYIISLLKLFGMGDDFNYDIERHIIFLSPNIEKLYGFAFMYTSADVRTSHLLPENSVVIVDSSELKNNFSKDLLEEHLYGRS